MPTLIIYVKFEHEADMDFMRRRCIDAVEGQLDEYEQNLDAGSSVEWDVVE